MSLLVQNTENHVKQDHPLWNLTPVVQEARNTDLMYTAPRSETLSCVPLSQIDEVSTSSTSHLNPNWLDNIKKNFQDIVVAKCSTKVHEAVAKNDKINHVNKKKEVRKELIDETISHLMDVHGFSTKPTIAEMRQIVFEMAFHYPAMFKEDEGHGYGLGGDRGLDGLANQMLDKLRKRQTAAKAEVSPFKGEKDQQPTRQKGKKAMIYGATFYH